jgi:hypothetical protein
MFFSAPRSQSFIRQNCIKKLTLQNYYYIILWTLEYQTISIKANRSNKKEQLTDSIELSPSWEVTSCSATQEFLKILLNPKFHYHVHKSPSLVPTLDQMNSVQTTPSYLSKIHFSIILQYSLGLPSGLFFFGSQPNITEVYQHYRSLRRSSNVLNSYFGGTRFESWLGHRLFLLKFFMVFISHSG